ncbi:MAG: DNA polymerase III subunit delta [Lachnospiraceae bacterium]|nr:DNA polymerase III subunit delta [Lachnospiraceae bacterium]
MDEWDKIIGQENAKAVFRNAVVNEHLSHAYILDGEAGSGKKTIAGLFAKTLQCEEGGAAPCGKCTSCIQADSRNHPDIIFFTGQKPGTIGVDEIRDRIVGDVAIRPYSSRYKIYILDGADTMTAQAQNALLKPLEEPPGYAVLILLTNNVNKLLPTIVSRSMTVRLNALDNKVVFKYLQRELHLDDTRAEITAALSRGNIGRARNLVENESFWQLKDDALRLLKNAESLTLAELLLSVRGLKENKNDIDEFFNLLTLWYRDALMVKATGESGFISFREEAAAVLATAKNNSYERLNQIALQIEDTRRKLRANVSFDIAMELLLLEIKGQEKSLK